MAKTAGCEGIISLGGNPIAGIRNMTVSINRTPIDVSDRLSDGYTAILAGKAGSRTLSIQVEGLEDGNVLRDRMLPSDADPVLTDLQFEFPGGDTLSGNFFFGDYTEGFPYQEATTFTANFTNSGAWTFTPAAT